MYVCLFFIVGKEKVAQYEKVAQENVRNKERTDSLIKEVSRLSKQLNDSQEERKRLTSKVTELQQYWKDSSARLQHLQQIQKEAIKQKEQNETLQANKYYILFEVLIGSNFLFCFILLKKEGNNATKRVKTPLRAAEKHTATHLKKKMTQNNLQQKEEEVNHLKDLLKTQTNKQSDNYNTLLEELQQWKTKAEGIDQLKNELQNTKKEKEKWRNDFEQMTSKLKHEQTLKHEFETQYSQLKANHTTLQNEHRSIQQQYTHLQQQYAAIQNELSILINYNNN
ncbi:hypothetical protein RFI_07815 [Reticulomyxa filosa]|uniref:Viral A-type inclusion protein n=1 Tax=Reticulomyxa filosa TaxID=46433 RepID=X6NTJ5_RETFI|nr:hypothetical protein RFI_07815 [Reticulomyxa filosa]|eukprot:ETO29306.1 hypothetical protein RFI_07815 [Reticulomyxa filosa]